MENIHVRKVPAKAVSIILKDPIPSCPHCKGTGVVNGLICSCRYHFGKEEDVSLLVAVEYKEDGSVLLDFEEEGETERSEEVEA